MEPNRLHLVVQITEIETKCVHVLKTSGPSLDLSSRFYVPSGWLAVECHRWDRGEKY